MLPHIFDRLREACALKTCPGRAIGPEEEDGCQDLRLFFPALDQRIGLLACVILELTFATWKAGDEQRAAIAAQTAAGAWASLFGGLVFAVGGDAVAVVAENEPPGEVPAVVIVWMHGRRPAHRPRGRGRPAPGR